MSGKPKRPSIDRVTEAAEAALATRHHVSPLDVFLGIGWLNGSTLAQWRHGQAACLEDVLQTSPERLAQAMTLFRSWAAAKELVPSETEYVARTPRRQALRFSASDNPAVEQLFRTRFVSSRLSERQQERVAQKASRPPELVVVQPLNKEWTCHRCGGSGDLLMMETPGPACLKCVGLDDLAFLPAGDALLTRRAKAKSDRHAVVVRFSRSRKRYERQGLLVEPRAVAEAQRQIEVLRR